jgi:D-sedoheptulose 7-phosphate isomerase
MRAHNGFCGPGDEIRFWFGFSPSRMDRGSSLDTAVQEKWMTNPGDFEAEVRRSIQASIALQELLLGRTEVLSAIAKASKLLVDAFRRGNKVLLFGNGGSAADAQHIAAEFVGRFAFDRPALPALALTVNASLLTAIGNDRGFDRVFSRQIEALARSDDVAIGISTSGQSQNVIQAIATTKKMKLHTIGLTSSRGKRLKQVVDHCILVPSTETAPDTGVSYPDRAHHCKIGRADDIS